MTWYRCPGCGYRVMSPRRCSSCQTKHDVALERNDHLRAAPRRVQLRRAAGWRKPEGAIVVARPGKWGNPISVSDVSGQYPSLNETQVARLVVRDFEHLARHGTLSLPNWRRASGQRGPVTWTYPSVAEVRAELAGHDLACWCAPGSPCHADVLLQIANNLDAPDGGNE